MLLWFLLVPLFINGQVKNQMGYPLMNLEVSSREAPVENYYQQPQKLYKTTITSVDHSNLVTVRDQYPGNTCVPFSVTSGLEFAHNMKHGSKQEPLFSPSFIYNFINANNLGSGKSSAFGFLQRQGCAKESLFPYMANDWKTLPNFRVMESALPYRIDSWSWWYMGDTLPRPDPGSYPIAVAGPLGLNIAKQVLASGNPVVMDWGITEGFSEKMHSDNWVYSYARFGQMPFIGSHSLLMVGYDDNKDTPDGPGAIRCLNSWGNNFDNGFVWVSYKAIAMQQYNGRFYSFKLRNNYQPKLFVELSLDSLSLGEYAWTYSGLKVNGNTYTQSSLSFQGAINYVYPKELVIDLTDLFNGDIASATFFLQMKDKQGSALNPVIKSLHFVDTSRNIDYYVTANTAVSGNTFYAEWDFRATDFSLSVQPADSVEVYEQKPLSVKVDATPEKQLHYSLITVPVIDGLNIDSSGNISWIPDYNQSGVYKFIVRGTDTEGASSTTEATVTVLHTNRAPAFSQTLQDQSVLVHNVGQQPFSFNYAASDPDDDQLTFTLAKGPAGSSITTTGQFTWLPTPDQASHSFPVVVYVSDGALVDSTLAVLTGSTLVGVEDIVGLPTEYSLSQNYPNPFNPATVIRFALPKASNVTIKIYDLLGREISTLVNEEISAGIHEVKFDASRLASGIYIYQITAADFSAVKKMTLTK